MSYKTQFCSIYYVKYQTFGISTSHFFSNFARKTTKKDK